MECWDEAKAARDIIRRGTSAHRQRAVYAEATADGADNREALNAVVDFLIEETLADI